MIDKVSVQNQLLAIHKHIFIAIQHFQTIYTHHLFSELAHA